MALSVKTTSMRALVQRSTAPPPQSSSTLLRRPSSSATTSSITRNTHPPPTSSFHPPHPSPPPSNVSPRRRLEAIRSAAPFSSFLTDSFARRHTYLRISLTERCNLRCTYCMPAAGIPLSPSITQLTTPEIMLLAELFVSQGVNKIRLTGGEPTVRKDILPLMAALGELRTQGLNELCITSNGVALRSKLDGMVAAGLTGINLSLDTLDPAMFEQMTRRRGFEKVWATVERVLEMNRLGAGVKLKINVVVIKGVNEGEILKFVELGKDTDLEVRFIEYMPFDGNRWAREKMFSYEEMLRTIKEKYPHINRVKDGPNETSKTWQVEGFVGKIGFVTSMTENFCGGCNRLRITSDGNMKVCLFGNSEVSLRDLLRESNGGEPIDKEAYEKLRAAEKGRSSGELKGVLASEEKERGLLEFIGAAVGRKKARHAGMGALENMKNRPMILIDDLSAPRNSRYSTHITISQNCASHRRQNGLAQVPFYLLHKHCLSPRVRSFSTTHPTPSGQKAAPPFSLPHLTSESEIHVVPISSKQPSHRIATAIASVTFSNPYPLSLIRSNSLRKGDVLSVSRVAGVMAAKRTPEIVPLCHSGIGIESVRVWVEPVEAGSHEDQHDSTGLQRKQLGSDTDDKVKSSQQERSQKLDDYLARPLGKFGGIRLAAEVSCFGKTGVEMEALCAVAGAGLSVLDMVKGVDKGCVLGELTVVQKSGGRSGAWEADGW